MKGASRFFLIFSVFAIIGVLLYIPVRIAIPWAAQASCDPSGNREHVFISHCLNYYFGDYEHGAYYYQLEPEAVEALRKADVLFLGNSRVQFAFSTDATAQFFKKAGISYYLLGFAYVQNSEFALRLIKHLGLHPKALIINADPFFNHDLKGPAANVVEGSSAVRFDYILKKWFQRIHPALCRAAPALCQPKHQTMYRDAHNGHWSWISTYSADNSLPFSPPESISSQALQDAIAAGRDFLDQAGVAKDCVVITGIPTRVASQEAATAIAKALGLENIIPPVSGLSTIDGEHLNSESARRWSEAFLPLALDRLRHCVAEPATTDRAQ
jgi:hypothetical protein